MVDGLFDAAVTTVSTICLRGTNLSRTVETEWTWENNSALQILGATKTFVNEKTWRQESHRIVHQTKLEVKMLARQNVREVRFQQPRVEFFSRKSALYHTRGGELHSRPIVIEIDERPDDFCRERPAPKNTVNSRIGTALHAFERIAGTGTGKKKSTYPQSTPTCRVLNLKSPKDANRVLRNSCRGARQSIFRHLHRNHCFAVDKFE